MPVPFFRPASPLVPLSASLPLVSPPISRAWVDSSWVRTSGNEGYHYNWYHPYYEHKPGVSFYALGMGHQFLYVNTARNVIIAWVGKDHYPPFWQMIFFDAFCEKFL